MSTIVTIHSDNTISVGATITGYCVMQRSTGTSVERWHNNGHPAPRNLGDIVTLPRSGYSLSSQAGRAAFDADFLAAWDAAETVVTLTKALTKGNYIPLELEDN